MSKKPVCFHTHRKFVTDEQQGVWKCLDCGIENEHLVDYEKILEENAPNYRLNPCPLCGRIPEFGLRVHTSDTWCIEIRCKCGLVFQADIVYDGLRIAAKKWNKRAVKKFGREGLLRAITVSIMETWEPVIECLKFKNSDQVFRLIKDHPTELCDFYQDKTNNHIKCSLCVLHPFHCGSSNKRGEVTTFKRLWNILVKDNLDDNAINEALWLTQNILAVLKEKKWDLEYKIYAPNFD